MHRFQRLSATSQTISAQLFEHERIIQDKDGVGLYDGKEKTVAFDNGRLYLTSHRLIYIDASNPHRNSRALDLGHVKQTEYWVGFLKSSPKITLVLGSDDAEVEQQQDVTAYSDESAQAAQTSTWACHVCGYRNLATGGSKCGLCGVTRSIDAMASPATVQPVTPSSSVNANQASVPVAGSNLIACPICTFLNHPSMVRCEVCESPLGTVTTPSSTTNTSRPSTPSTPRPPTPAVPGTTGTPPFVRLSFRKGGDKLFYAAFKTALKAKEWDRDGGRKAGNRRSIPPASGSEIDPASGHRMTTFGINGILKTIDLDARDREDDMQEALSDLEALMARAKEMLHLAQSLNAKLADSSLQDACLSGEEEQANTAVRQSLVSLGLSAPAVTAEMAEDEKEYHMSLAKELGSVLLGTGTARAKNGQVPVMQDGKGKRGLIGLDEIWCLWNRARGVALVSPKDLKYACDYLPIVTRPEIRLRTFKSGLTVLHVPYFSEAVFSSRLVESLASTTGLKEEVPGLSNLEVAQMEGISVVLAQQMVEMLENRANSVVVRDEGDPRQGTTWQINYFEELEKSWTDVNM